MSRFHPHVPTLSTPVWSAARVARLGFLVGMGLTSRAVAEDPRIGSTPASVRAQARRLGLTFREAATALRLPPAVLVRYDTAAARRGLNRDDLLRLILLNAGSDDALIENILDDRS